MQHSALEWGIFSALELIAVASDKTLVSLHQQLGVDNSLQIPPQWCTYFVLCYPLEYTISCDNLTITTD